MFAILDEVPKDDTTTLSTLWTRLSAMLEVHAEAEEELFYPRLLELGQAPARRHREGRDRRRHRRSQRHQGRDPRRRRRRGRLDGLVEGRQRRS